MTINDFSFRKMIVMNNDGKQKIRARWIIFNPPVISTTISTSYFASDSADTHASELPQQVILLKRMFKEQILQYSKYDICTEDPSQLFVDIDDHTLWKVFYGPMTYDKLVQIDMNDDLSMYEVDAFPSEKLVSLRLLQQSLLQ